MQETTIDELAEARRAGAVLVDVRETEEYVEGHVPGAIHIPLGQLEAKAQEVPSGEVVYIICRSGVRSQQGAEILSRQGYSAISVAGGTMGWIQAGHAVVTGPERG